jgi:ribosomal protein S18 acetylase RimI-like enzyme
VIRPAEPADVPAIRAVVDAAYRHYIARIGKPPGPMEDDYAARVARGQVWVLTNPSHAIEGILVLEDMPDGAVLLDNVAVAPDAQGQGHGRALIAFAETEAQHRGSGVLRLYTHILMTENIALYKRVGFVETARVTEKGFQRVYMEKRLHRD